VFFLGSGTGTTITVGGALASFGLTPGVFSEPGAIGSTEFCARTGVAANSNVANVKTGTLFIDLISVQKTQLSEQMQLLSAP
jgi:hypothetical protein